VADAGGIRGHRQGVERAADGGTVALSVEHLVFKVSCSESSRD
jgi:hypothetical protein